MAVPVKYSTTISASQTAAEMQALLAQHGARRISIDYDQEAVPCAIEFTLETPHGQRSFALPAEADRMEQLLAREEAAGRLKAGSRAERTSRAQAERVAWRVMKTWLEAQLALVDAALIDMDQALFPFLKAAPDKTLFEVYRERESLALGGGASS